jgi:hypothetical protein
MIPMLANLSFTDPELSLTSGALLVSFKRGNSVAFNQGVFIKLLINFIISNLLAL